jgi:hypothetical protein
MLVAACFGQLFGVIRLSVREPQGQFLDHFALVLLEGSRMALP